MLYKSGERDEEEDVDCAWKEWYSVYEEVGDGDMTQGSLTGIKATRREMSAQMMAREGYFIGL